jgi:hypothetical protein
MGGMPLSSREFLIVVKFSFVVRSQCLVILQQNGIEK